MEFLYQYKWKDVGYPLRVIPEMIWVSREVTNSFVVSYSWITVDMQIWSIRSISDVWNTFSIDEDISCWLIFEKTPIFINTGFRCSSKYGISPTHYVGAAFLAQEHFLDFICDGFHLKDFLWWGMTKHDPRRSEIIPLFGKDSHHETAWCILNINQFFCYTNT